MEGAGRSMASIGADVFSEESIVKYEAVVVCSVVRDKSHLRASEGSSGDAVRLLLESFEAAGLKVQVLEGKDHKVFIKVAATDKVIGRAAETLQLKKLTNLGLQTVFDWELRDSFMRQLHGQSLFSWTERYYLLHHIIHSLKFEGPGEVQFDFTNPSGKIDCITLKPGVPIMSSFEEVDLVADIFPSHDEHTRKDLLHEWSLNWSGGTSQPLDAIYSYFGPKIALYFAFLEMYTNWLIFPAVTGTLFYFLVDLGKWSPLIPPLSAVTMVSWAALFLQFWKRRNLSILERWELRLEDDEMNTRMPWDNSEEEPLIEQHGRAPECLVSGKGVGIDSSARRALNREEWTDRLMIVRNIAVVLFAVMVFQIPFELLYAALSQKATSTIAKLFSISCYLYCIQKFKVIGGKLAVRLNNAQAHVSSEAAADSLIYKVFWIYFAQSYIGVFYHAFVLQDFKLLRQTLIDRMLMAQVINNVMESLVPYLSYLYASRTYNSEKKGEEATGEKVTDYSNSRVEKEFFKPRYITDIAGDQYEGLFDDYLELALQFGIVVMFASFFPLVAVLALVNNLVEIRSDSFKLLEMMKRPVPHIVGSIGAWLHIFQYMSGAAIVSNCLLLLLMFDKDGEWRMDPGLAGVLVLEHALLAARFGLAWLVPEVPAWVKAKRRKRSRMQEGYSLHVLRSISKKMLSSRQSM